MKKILEHDKLKIKVNVSPFVFSNERAVSFYCSDHEYSLVVDESLISDGYMSVGIMSLGSASVRVRLPSQTITGIGVIDVPWAEIERSWSPGENYHNTCNTYDPWQGIASGMLNSGSEYRR